MPGVPPTAMEAVDKALSEPRQGDLLSPGNGISTISTIVVTHLTGWLVRAGHASYIVRDATKRTSPGKVQIVLE